MAQRLIIPGSIQVTKRGARRLPRRSEALALALGALGSVNRHAGVKTLNLIMNGKPVALALIENASFGQDTEGNTTLNEADSELENQNDG
jgi:hypothetical protein